MLFNSEVFLFAFLPLTLLAYFAAGRFHARLAAAVLTLASLLFYGWWSPRFLGLLIASILFNYGAGMWLARLAREAGRERPARWVLAGAITANLALLGFFKYANFFIANVNGLTGTSWAALDIVLPLGISFYTFTQIAFLVDARRGAVRRYDVVHYFLFVTYFPHLIAGPILHHARMVRQFERREIYSPRLRNLATGLAIFAVGLFKKVVLADQFARYADPFFTASAAQAVAPAPFESWMGALSYTLQLYFDFSAYCDMAVGISLMFNVRLPFNFNSPYKATSIIEFWRRWHMTLSAFLRDYLYVPLGGNRRGPLRRYVNLMMTMVLGGLWHGASWTFVLWGALHGAFLVVNHGWRALAKHLGLPRVPGIALPAALLTLLCVVFAWVPFRAHDLAHAMRIWSGMVGGSDVPWAWAWNQREKWLLAGFAIVWLLPNLQAWARLPGSLRPRWAGWMRFTPSLPWGLACGVLFAAALFSFGRESPFLYFQF
jgi:alginate O-acetyltransferase complex protein AlgI